MDAAGGAFDAGVDYARSKTGPYIGGAIGILAPSYRDTRAGTAATGSAVMSGDFRGAAVGLAMTAGGVLGGKAKVAERLAEAARSIPNPFAGNRRGFFTTTPNANGGTVHTSTGIIVQNDFKGIVTSEQYNGRNVDILSGGHGVPDGSFEPDPEMLEFDRQTFDGAPGVTVHDFGAMTAEDLRRLTDGPGATIGGFCGSGACFGRLLGE